MSDRFQRNDRSRFAAAKGIFNYMTAISVVVLWLPWLAYSVHDRGLAAGASSAAGSSASSRARFLAQAGRWAAQAPAGSLLERLMQLLRRASATRCSRCAWW